MDLSQVECSSKPFRPVAAAIDTLALENPEKAFASVPRDPSDLSVGFEDITYRHFANTVNRASWFIDDKLGRAVPNSFPTLAYIGPSDLRYYILTIACVKTGYKLLLLLPRRNSNSGLQHLLRSTQCSILLYGSEDAVSGVELSKLKTVLVPAEPTLLCADPVPPYAYMAKSPECLNDPLFVLHTSGSSGLQKPVVYRQGNLALFGPTILLPDAPDGRLSSDSARVTVKRMFNAFPIAHGGGVCSGLVWAVYFGATIVLTKNDPLSVRSLKAVLLHGHVDAAMLTPYTCAELSKSPEVLELTHALNYIYYAGGPLQREVGEILREHVHTLCTYGQTENLSPISYLTDPEDWQYFAFAQQPNNCDFQPRSEGLYELVLIKNTDLSLRYFQSVFWIWPELHEWKTSDLWSKHPTKADHWKYEGRVDDMIILDSGHNFFPIPYEKDILAQNTLIKTAVILGNGRPNLAVVIELNQPDLLQTDRKGTIERVNESLKKCNEVSTMKAQIPYDHIVFCDQRESLPRTGKGTISRASVETAFSQRIEQVYRQ